MEPSFVIQDIFGRCSREHLLESAVGLNWMNWKSFYMYKRYQIEQNAWIPQRHLEQFKCLRNTKCTIKVECLFKKMLFSRTLKPELNVRTDPIRVIVLVDLFSHYVGYGPMKDLRLCLRKNGPVDFAWVTDLGHLLCVVRHSCTYTKTTIRLIGSLYFSEFYGNQISLGRRPVVTLFKTKIWDNFGRQFTKKYGTQQKTDTTAMYIISNLSIEATFIKITLQSSKQEVFK